MNDVSKFSRTCLLVLAFAMTLSFGSQTMAWQGSPQLNIIQPRGIQRGLEHELTFTGVRLQETQEVFLYSAGITVSKLEQVDANNVKATVSVDKECRLGEHIAQLRTAFGISEYRSFFVGALPVVAEVEPNNDFEKPQPLEHNFTVAGTITSEDVDHYQIKVTKGQRVSVEIEAIRLGTFMVDPYLAILDEKRFEVFAQDDTLLLKQDSFISFVAPEDATYTILVRESAYGGNPSCFYRLHVGNFPRPSTVFPAGGKEGETIKLKLMGDPSGEIEHETVVAKTPFRDGIFYSDDKGITPSPLAFRVSNLENLFETEPNSNLNETNLITVPCAINGIIQEANDFDHFSFEATKGQVFDFEVYSRRINSPLDALLNTFGPDKKVVAANDDSRGADSYLRFTAPADGTCYFQMRDLLRRGGPDFVYRVEITVPKPNLVLSIPRVARYSQYRQSVFVPQGNRFATLISATRGDFAGDLKLLQDQLPPGITMHSSPMAANLNLMPVVFEATADAQLSGALVDLIGSHVEDEKQIKGGYENSALFVGGQPNNTEYIGANVDRLPMAVVKPLPFKINIVQAKAPLVRDGSINLKVVVERAEGFTKPITLQFPFRPPGIGTRPNVVIPEGKNEALYPLNANASAQIREWPIYILANADVGGNGWASSQLASLNVAERFVTLEMQRASCDQGKATQFVCKMTQITPFEGKATAQLYGLPPNATANTIEFDKTTTDLVFEVTTTAETPVGKHGVFCQARIPVNDELSVAVAGRSELQVDKPLPAKAAEPAPVATAAAEPAKPVEKPLSRLEKLRKAAREQKGQQ